MRRVGAVVLLMPTLALALAGCGDRALWDRWCSERDLWHAERSAQQVIARGASVRAADRERVERALDAVAERLPSAPGAEGPSHDVARLAGRALVLIGRLHESAGDIDGARTAYQRVVSAPAADEGMRSEAHAALAALALRAARFDEALAEEEMLARAEPIVEGAIVPEVLQAPVTHAAWSPSTRLVIAAYNPNVVTRRIIVLVSKIVPTTLDVSKSAVIRLV